MATPDTPPLDSSDDENQEDSKQNMNEKQINPYAPAQKNEGTMKIKDYSGGRRSSSSSSRSSNGSRGNRQ